MRLFVSSNIRITEPSYEVQRYCQDYLTIDNPDYLTAERLGKYVGRMPKKMKLYVKSGDTLILPFGCLQTLWSMCNKTAQWYTDFHGFRGNKMQGNINLYDYQELALQSLLKAKNGILRAPCGSGKTQIGLQLIKSIGGKALWLTHTQKLLEQSKSRCELYFSGDFGTITDGAVNIGKDITFATVQTMSKIDPNVYRDEFDIVVVDECHHCVGSPTKVMQFYKILTNCNARYKYGLSATLSRSDNLLCTLYSIIGDVAYEIPKSAVGNKIIKAEHRKIDVDIEYPYQEYLDFDGTINYNYLINMLSCNDNRNDIIVSNVRKEYQNGNKQLILCHRVKHVEQLANLCKEFCQVACITGAVSKKQREYNADVIVATYALAKEGLDIPDLNVLHLATPQKNDSTTAQAVGRIERNIDGKQTPICYDYVDNRIDYCIKCYKKRKAIIKRK